MSYSATIRTALSAFGRSASVSAQRLSANSSCPKNFVQGSRLSPSGHQTTHPRIPSPFHSPQVPNDDKSMTALSSAIPQQSKVTGTEFDTANTQLDWTESVYGLPKVFSSEFAPTVRDSVISSSDGSSLAPTESFSKGEQSSIPISTAIPNDSDKTARQFKRHGNQIFAELSEKYPRSQSQ